MLQILEKFIEEADNYKEDSVHHAIVLIGTLSDYPRRDTKPQETGPTFRFW